MSSPEMYHTVGEVSLTGLVINIVLLVVWIILIWWLFKNGHTTWAWIVLIVPIVIFIMLILFAGIAVGGVTYYLTHPNSFNRNQNPTNQLNGFSYQSPYSYQ